MSGTNGYWEGRYASGGDSGEGSRGLSRTFKWSVIESLIGPIASYKGDVLDVGCGDLSFWDRQNCERYLGLDISPTVLSANRSKRPRWSFECLDCTDPGLDLHGECVLCLDMLFHIMDDQAYLNIVRNLGRWTGKFLFIHTWQSNPLERVGLFKRDIKRTTDGSYQTFRHVDGMFDVLRSAGLVMVEAQPNPNNKWGTMYAFKRPESRTKEKCDR
jgi:hypothetical protein